MSRWLNRLQPWGALLLRLVLGIAMIAHGYTKVVPAHGLWSHPLAPMERYSHFVATLGVPSWLGYISATTEFIGGMLLVIGLLTRLTALLIATNMLVAIVTVTRHKGYSGSEYALALLAIALMLLFFGPGAAALDRRFHLS